MLRLRSLHKFTLGVAVALGALTYFDAIPDDCGSSHSTLRAQDQNRSQRNRNNGGRFGGPGQGGPGGNSRFSPQQIVASMTAERFERMKNSPMASRLRETVGEAQWQRWETGNFAAATDANAAEAAAAAAEGRPVEVGELTEEEKAQADALLAAGSVPNFSDGKPYSQEAENEYMTEILAHRDDTLTPALPLALRFYCRYFLSKYDKNGDGSLQRQEWEDVVNGAQAIDLDGDWILTEQEILFYLARYAKDRTVANPRPVQSTRRPNMIVDKAEQKVLIRTASAAPKLASQEELDKELNAPQTAEELDALSDEEFMNLFTEGNPAMEIVDDSELLDVLLTDMDESSVREYAPAPADMLGVPVWFIARDVNGDGQLTLREFAPNLSPSAIAQFGKLDANADGFITSAEIKQATGQK